MRKLAVAALGVGLATALHAQAAPAPMREIRGLDFRPTGAWRVLAGQVRARRAQLLSLGAFAFLNAPLATHLPIPTPEALAGVLRIPTVMFQYPDLLMQYSAQDYQSVLFASTPPAGRPYTLRSFYQQLSSGLLDIQGDVFGPVTLSETEEGYAGHPPCVGNPTGSSMCNGLFSNGFTPTPFQSMQAGLREALRLTDPSVDFSSYADTSGYIPLVVFLQPGLDGACGGPTNNHLWSHRDYLNPPFETNDPDPAHPGQHVFISDYTVQSAVGGAIACDSALLMPVGTIAHETGHGFGLPDLYGTDGNSEGIGQFGLMGSGNYSTPFSPSRMEAWSLNELGWVTIAPVTAAGAFTLGPAATSDSALLVRPFGNNPRGEYFLIENREPVGSDSAMVRVHCQASVAVFPTFCNGGLLIWHVDSQQVADGAPYNVVNDGPVHGLELVQADGRGNLDAMPGTPQSNRGDAGDPYPGVQQNRDFSFATFPPATLNYGHGFAGVSVDSITPVTPGGAMAFHIHLGLPSQIHAADTNTVVLVDGAPYHSFVAVLDEGTLHTVSVPDTQIPPDGRTRYTFQSWSDGQAQTHTITGHAAGDSLVATLHHEYRLRVGTTPGGHLVTNPAIDTTGQFFNTTDTIRLTVTVDSAVVFLFWGGDTSTATDTLTIEMHRPFDEVAVLDTPLVITAAHTRPNAVMGLPYHDSLTYKGGTPAHGGIGWAPIDHPLPDSLILAADGAVTGVPAVLGTFSYKTLLGVGVQSAVDSFSITITAPVVATQDIVTQLLGRGTPLTAPQVEYLDLLGNRNGQLDVGDFLAWLQHSGVSRAEAGRLVSSVIHRPPLPRSSP
ncbi:MAG TPA: M6 family metalloprotease domain-containing protein [Gemmatimonadales bacterium]|nr:M6 family metalloprotease domain-containing protein [Gemmatimonadales bacterium]